MACKEEILASIKVGQTFDDIDGVQKRSKQHVMPCGCPFQFRVSFDPKFHHKYVITKVNSLEHNHLISAEVIKDDRVKARANLNAKNFASKALVAGAVPNRVRKQLELDFGLEVDPKFLQNLKQRLIGLPKNEWHNAARLLQEYGKIEGNVVKVWPDEEKIIELIYIQLKQQRQLYELFPEMIQIDLTHGISKGRQGLMTILVEDNFGKGQPVTYICMRTKNTQSILE